jgi:uncharacterized protein YjiS (DUF1127 family)
MLYRNPEIPAHRSLFVRAFSALTDLAVARRRRLAELDLLSMNAHLKRDLGLVDADIFSRR